MTHPLFAKHQELLRRALAAAQSRRYWNPYADGLNPEAADATAVDQGREALEAYRGAQFYLDQPGLLRRCGAEVSPYGLPLSVSYPQCAPDVLIAAAKSAGQAWAKSAAAVRVGICLEVLERLQAGGMELAQVIMHTTGQPFSLARSQGVAQALARGLEATAVAWREMSVIAATSIWDRPVTATDTVRLHKRFVVVPRGIGLVMSCATTPTWMAYPAIFANLATGNPVIIKPHPAVILPLALTVAVIRQTLKEFGFDPNLVSLLVDEADAPIAREVAIRPEIALIDYSGHAEFAHWLRANAAHATLFAFTSATNCVVIDSTHDYKGMLRYLVASMSWYSGQLPTSPQTIFIPETGIATNDGQVLPAQFCRDLGYVLGKLLDDPARALAIAGAIQSPATMTHLATLRDALPASARVVRDAQTLDHPHWPTARLRTPLLVRCSLDDEALFGPECQGPVNFVVETATSSEALAVSERIMREHGGLDLQVYTTNTHVLQLAEDAALRAGVRLSVNLTGTLTQVMALNFPGAFSDIQGGGGNPASTAAMIDGPFVSRRFSFAELRNADWA